MHSKINHFALTFREAFKYYFAEVFRKGGYSPPPFAKFFGFLFFVDLGSIQETLLKISGKKSQTRAKNCVFALDTAKMGHKKA